MLIRIVVSNLCRRVKVTKAGITLDKLPGCSPLSAICVENKMPDTSSMNPHSNPRPKNKFSYSKSRRPSHAYILRI